MFPVDLLSLDHTDLTSASQTYLSFVESRPRTVDWFESSTSSKVCVTAENIKRLQVFDHPECFLLALHLSDDPTQVVAVYLPDRWWAVDDVLRTSTTSRGGLQWVQSLTERVLVFLLSQVVDRPLQEEVLFSAHPPTETCKLLWTQGEAVGFYSVKLKGSLCDGWSGRCYQLTVLDTLLVRRRCRRRGLGLRILDDFCNSFSTEDELGVSAPLSTSMVSVLTVFLQRHQELRQRLYEVEAPGGWAQRRNIWINIRLGRYAHAQGPGPDQTGIRKGPNRDKDQTRTRADQDQTKTRPKPHQDWDKEQCRPGAGPRPQQPSHKQQSLGGGGPEPRRRRSRAQEEEVQSPGGGGPEPRRRKSRAQEVQSPGGGGPGSGH